MADLNVVLKQLYCIDHCLKMKLYPSLKCVKGLLKKLYFRFGYLLKKHFYIYCSPSDASVGTVSSEKWMQHILYVAEKIYMAMTQHGKD